MLIPSGNMWLLSSLLSNHAIETELKWYCKTVNENLQAENINVAVKLAVTIMLFEVF